MATRNDKLVLDNRIKQMERSGLPPRNSKTADRVIVPSQKVQRGSTGVPSLRQKLIEDFKSIESCLDEVKLVEPVEKNSMPKPMAIKRGPLKQNKMVAVDLTPKSALSGL